MTQKCYGLVDFIEDLIEELIMAAEVLIDYLCPFCRRKTVHRLFRENPDGAYDEVGLRCSHCKKVF
jgi:ribosomal protein L37AE/L43A